MTQIKLFGNTIAFILKIFVLLMSTECAYAKLERRKRENRKMENQKTVTVLKQKNEHFLVHWAENELTPFVVCTDYNQKTNSWIWGHYFCGITSAIDYFEMEYGNRQIHYDRLCELATLFKDGLMQDDFESALEYFEDSCEMEKSEMDFFGITDEIQEKRNQEIQWLLNETDNMDFEDIDLDCIFD